MKSEQIIQNALRLHSIFNLLKNSARNFEGQASDYEIQEFLGDLADVCEIGKETASLIFKSGSEIEADEKFVPFENYDDERPITDNPKTDNLALAISGLLNNEDLPDAIKEGLKEGVTLFYNEKRDQTEINKYMDSPEFLANLLKKQ